MRELHSIPVREHDVFPPTSMQPLSINKTSDDNSTISVDDQQMDAAHEARGDQGILMQC